ncbi:hypothetical protein HJC99_06835 [Candidatus Saccharibacteria bacterium]|nr:hypothetical protein [Candidatus Saccharibacteria bacterium]
MLVLVTLPLSARADAVGLRLAPLKYEQNLTATKPQLGFIDVSNPSDASVTISTSVQGFRQTGTDGNLDYYDNPALVAAIVPDLSTFSLGPREAARVSFTINQSKLPQGGVYAVIFFRTVPVGGAAADSYISQSAKVGTLLILNNGGQPVAGGTMTASAPWWQFGSGLSTELTYTLPPSANVGLEPKLSSQIYPWGTSTTVATGLVLPGASRTFTVSRPGSYFGIIPIKITDALTHKTATAYTIAITGWYQTLVVLLVALGIALGLRYRLRPRDIIDAVAHPLDGLSHRD